MNFYTRIINKKGGYEGTIAPNQATKSCSIKITGFRYSYFTVRVTSFAGTLELILSKNNSETQGRNNESRVTKDRSPYLKGR